MTELLKVKKIRDLEEDNWVAVEGKVVELWGSSSSSISQIGLLGDETGTIKFISWEKSDLPDLEENKVYLINNGVVDSWEGDTQLKLNRRSQIKEIDKKIKVKRSDTLEGEILALTPRTDVILKCPSCNRTVKENVCVVHGEIEPKKDIRIGLAINVGSEIKKVEFSEEEASEVAGLSAQQAHSLGKEKLLSQLEDKLIGREVKLNYSKSNGILFAKNVELKRGN